MSTTNTENQSESKSSSYRLLMEMSWKDHLHTRTQTWKSLQIESFLAAGLLGVDLSMKDEQHLATILIGILVMFASYFGAKISIHHRYVMIKNFDHIKKCEEKLGLTNTIVLESHEPTEIKLWHAFDPRENNTAVYILRMHIALIIFAIVFVILRSIPLAIEHTETFWAVFIPIILFIIVYVAFGAGLLLNSKDKNK